MQRLQQVFRSNKVEKASPSQSPAPVPLTAEELKKVAGGLPAIGGLRTPPTSTKLG